MSRYDLNGIGMTSQRTRDRLVKRLAENGIDHDEVLTAVATVPRHIFIDEALAHRAYEDVALPIGHGQTISQPFIVALMTQSLLNRPRARVLEVGTGSGYQSAVLACLAPLVQKIYTLERIDSLMERAQERLRAMKCGNVRFKHADGYQGWLGKAHSMEFSSRQPRGTSLKHCSTSSRLEVGWCSLSALKGPRS